MVATTAISGISLLFATYLDDISVVSEGFKGACTGTPRKTERKKETPKIHKCSHHARLAFVLLLINILIEIKYYEDVRPGQQLEAAQRQHADLCKLINAKVVTLHTTILGVGGTCYTEHP
eukprot:1150847-Pelagomonas_calceolata.AAC.1